MLLQGQGALDEDMHSLQGKFRILEVVLRQRISVISWIGSLVGW